jgi:multiple sugar transport system substrate-binding protein
MRTGSARYSRRQFLRGSSAVAAGLAGAGGAGAQQALSAGRPSTAQLGRYASSRQQASITFLARGDEPIFAVFRELRTAFNQAEPGITVEVEEVPGGEWYQRFQLALASGTAPDCVFESAGTITASIRNGALHPVDEFIAGDARFNRDDYFDISFHTVTFDGKTYGLPYDGGSLALYYNQELFEAAGIPVLDPQTPLSWDQILEYGRALTVDMSGRHPGEAGFDPTRVRQYGILPPSNIYECGVFAWGNGGEVISEAAQVPIDEPASAEGLQFLADLIAVHHIAPVPAIDQAGQASFLTGTIAMEYSGVWNTVRYRDAAFAWGVAPFPLGKVRTSTGFYSPLAITAASENKEAAWRWISFCCSEEGQRIVASLGQAVPPLRSLASSEVFLNPERPPENEQVFLDEMDPEFLRTPGDKMGRWFGGYSQEFPQIFDPAFDPVWRGEKPAAEAAAEVRPKLEHLLATGEVT